MAQYQIFLLPILALALVVFFPLFDKNLSLSRSWRSARRRRTVAGRSLVLALLASTLVTQIWPSTYLSDLSQGILLTVLMMLPVCIVYVKLFLRYNNSRHKSRQSAQNAARTKPAGTALFSDSDIVPICAFPVNQQSGRDTSNTQADTA